MIECELKWKGKGSEMRWKCGGGGWAARLRRADRIGSNRIGRTDSSGRISRGDGSGAARVKSARAQSIIPSSTLRLSTRLHESGGRGTTKNSNGVSDDHYHTNARNEGC